MAVQIEGLKGTTAATLNTAFKALIIQSTNAEEDGDKELADQLNDYAMRCFRMRQTLTRKPRQPKDSK